MAEQDPITGQPVNQQGFNSLFAPEGSGVAGLFNSPMFNFGISTLAAGLSDQEVNAGQGLLSGLQAGGQALANQSRIESQRLLNQQRLEELRQQQIQRQAQQSILSGLPEEQQVLGLANPDIFFGNEGIFANQLEFQQGLGQDIQLAQFAMKEGLVPTDPDTGAPTAEGIRVLEQIYLDQAVSPTTGQMALDAANLARIRTETEAAFAELQEKLDTRRGVKTQARIASDNSAKLAAEIVIRNEQIRDTFAEAGTLLQPAAGIGLQVDRLFESGLVAPDSASAERLQMARDRFRKLQAKTTTLLTANFAAQSGGRITDAARANAEAQAIELGNNADANNLIAMDLLNQALDTAEINAVSLSERRKMRQLRNAIRDNDREKMIQLAEELSGFRVDADIPMGDVDSRIESKIGDESQSGDESRRITTEGGSTIEFE